MKNPSRRSAHSLVSGVSSVGVLRVSLRDCSSSSFCFFFGLGFFLSFFLGAVFLFSVSTGASLFFFIHFFNFSFNVPNIFSRGNSIL